MPTSIANQELARTSEETAQRLSASAASIEMTKAHISASREMIARSLQTLGVGTYPIGATGHQGRPTTG